MYVYELIIWSVSNIFNVFTSLNTVSYSEATLWLDVQHSENSLIQHSIAHSLCTVCVGRHLCGKHKQAYTQLVQCQLEKIIVKNEGIF